MISEQQTKKAGSYFAKVHGRLLFAPGDISLLKRLKLDEAVTRSR